MDDNTYIIGGIQPTFYKTYTWAQIRTVVSSDGFNNPPVFGLQGHSMKYPFRISPPGVLDDNWKMIRGAPYGTPMGFKFEYVPGDPVSYEYYFFWGQLIEVIIDGEITYIQSFGTSIDNSELAEVLDDVSITCQNASFITNSSARDSSGMGQYIGTFPNAIGPGEIIQIAST